jgi:PIN domain nuclease of toxin-antitoxin system
MRLLLDTHVFLWYISADLNLPATFRDAIRDPANDVYLSVASVWEAVINYALGKLPLPEAPAGYLPRQRDAKARRTAIRMAELREHLVRPEPAADPGFL